jgi:hypothetical protein
MGKSLLKSSTRIWEHLYTTNPGPYWIGVALILFNFSNLSIHLACSSIDKEDDEKERRI